MKLKEYIEFKRVSKTRVAKELKVTPQHLYDILRGKAFPGRKLATQIKRWSSNAVTYEDLWE